MAANWRLVHLPVSSASSRCCRRPKNVGVPLRNRRAGRTRPGRSESRRCSPSWASPPHRQRPGELSGGRQQRVAIGAGAGGQPPDLLVADEPTGQLDLSRCRQIMRLLLTVVRSEGTSRPWSRPTTRHSMDLADHVLRLEGRPARAASPPRAPPVPATNRLPSIGAEPGCQVVARPCGRQPRTVRAGRRARGRLMASLPKTTSTMPRSRAAAIRYSAVLTGPSGVGGPPESARAATADRRGTARGQGSAGALVSTARPGS